MNLQIKHAFLESDRNRPNAHARLATFIAGTPWSLYQLLLERLQDGWLQTALQPVRLDLKGQARREHRDMVPVLQD